MQKFPIHDLVDMNHDIKVLEAMVRGLNLIAHRDWFIAEASQSVKAQFEYETKELQQELELFRARRDDLVLQFTSSQQQLLEDFEEFDAGYPLP